jgi:hypothetical protein
MADQPNISDRVTPNAQIIFADGRRELCYVQMLKDAPQAAVKPPKKTRGEIVAEQLLRPHQLLNHQMIQGGIAFAIDAQLGRQREGIVREIRRVAEIRYSPSTKGFILEIANEIEQCRDLPVEERP